MTATPSSGSAITYKYDAFGRRIERLVGSSNWTKYTYDGQDVVLDQRNDGSNAEYLNGLGIDDKIRQIDSATGQALYFTKDHLGSTRTLTDSSGNIVESLNYDSFGNSGGSTNTRFLFTGREFDPDTSLYFSRARWYDPTLGRFISEDPIGLNGGINQYQYVGANPLNWRDPLGLIQQGPVNPFRDPFSFDHYFFNAASNTFSDLFHLDDVARDGWILGDPCRSTGDRLWAGYELANIAANDAMVGAGVGAMGRSLAGRAGAALEEAGATSEAATETLGADELWQKLPIERGNLIEDAVAETDYHDWHRVGAEGNGKFPLVDFQEGNTLVSLKSVDTEGATWLNRMQGHIRDLERSGLTVGGEPANLVLDLRVQPGGVGAAESLIEYGSARNVIVRIKEFP